MSENDEPHTPKELAQVRVERATRDAHLALSELEGFVADPIAEEFVRTQAKYLTEIHAKAAFLDGYVEGAATPLRRAS